MANSVSLRSDKGSRSVTLSYPDLPYLGLWHAPKSDAPYLCIEPWTSLPSRQDIVEDFAFKSDMIRLKQNSSYHSCWSITLK
jgi:galactose mutarotase-like enzyme